MTRRLLLLFDSRAYARSNCYIGQLCETLAAHYRVRMLSLREIRYLPLVRPGSYDRVLSLLRLRTLHANLPRIRKVLGGAPMFVYDQDVWQSFMDGSPWKGAYGHILSELNVESFLVTSRWWRDFVAAKGLPVRFVRMGMLPRYCDPGPDWDARPSEVAFQGTVHPHRRAFFDELARLGLEVELFPSAPYQAFLANLHAMRVFVHTEDQPWQVDGVSLRRNALWIKETEAAARGTFSIRDHEDEADAYGIAELPTILTYREVREVPGIVASLRGMPARERRDRMVAAAEAMKRRDDWTTVVDAIEGRHGA
jgi:hypothetical protein